MQIESFNTLDQRRYNDTYHIYIALVMNVGKFEVATLTRALVLKWDIILVTMYSTNVRRVTSHKTPYRLFVSAGCPSDVYHSRCCYFSPRKF